MKELVYGVMTAPLTWIALSLVFYEIAKAIAARAHTPLANPLLIAAVLMGALLVFTDMPLPVYRTGGDFLTLMLTPATMALAVPIYRQLETLRRNLLPILAGALVGSIVSIASVYVLSRALDLRWEVLASLLPKSVTTAIAMPLAELMGGLPALTAVVVAFTGLVGAVFLPPFLRLIGVRDKVAAGIAIGTASHAVGTSRAIELGETEGAMSSLAIGVAGLITAGLVTIVSMFL